MWLNAGSINFGRAPVRAVYAEALEIAATKKTNLLAMVTHCLPLSEAAHGYEIFEKQQAHKVVLKTCPT